MPEAAKGGCSLSRESAEEEMTLNSDYRYWRVRQDFIDRWASGGMTRAEAAVEADRIAALAVLREAVERKGEQ